MIWVIDDDASIRFVFDKALDVNSISHRLFETGDEALAYLKTEVPDVIVSDINMPGIDGLEAARQIREKYPHIIIYILTAYRQFDYVREAMHAAVNDYLVKPIKPEDLVHILKKGVEQALRYRIKKMQQQRVMKKLEEQEPLVLQQRIYELLNKKDKEVQLLRLFRYVSHRHTFFPVAVVCLAYWKSIEASVSPFNRNFGQVYASKFEKYAVSIQTEQELILVFDSWNSAIRDKLRHYIKICENTHGITFCSSIVMAEKMKQYMREQMECWESILRQPLSPGAGWNPDWKETKHLVLFGSGSSYYAGRIAAEFLKACCGMRTAGSWRAKCR